jgi:hypothetical protein
MSEPNVMVSFRLDRDRPLRLRWLATDGVPGDGYKAQVTAIVLGNGTKLAMDASAILEQAVPDAAGGTHAYYVTFTGMLGYAADHPDRAAIDKLSDGEVDYALEFVRDDEDERHVAKEGEDYTITDRPKATATKLTRRNA